ncbi:MAG: zinc-finger domain-containing protein [Alphaproteobacteria bacterium]|nr:zinc-finger domain-containing protein [Alphaproteobacteria bacterium]
MTETNAIKVTETVETDHPVVTCDSHGHPRVALRVSPETREVVCPYCSRRFVLAHGAKTPAH